MVASSERAVANTGSVGPRTASTRPPLVGVVLVAAAACLLVFLAGDRMVRGVAAILSPVEAMYGESIIYDQAARLARGEVLYQPLDRAPFTVAAYTPLYYVLVAGLQRLALPPFVPGRVLSLAALAVAAVLVGRLTVHRTNDRRAGWFAGLLFVAFGFPGDFPWFAFYKEDMLGVALSLGALVLLDGGTNRRHAAWAGALAGLAFLTKQTILAVSVAGFVWLWVRGRPSALVFAATSALVGLGPCIVLAWSDRAFLDNTILANLNPTSVELLRSNLEVVVRFQGAIVLLALLPVLTGALPWRRWLLDPLVLFWLISSLLVPIGLSKVGSNSNYWIDWAAASAVLGTRGVWLLALGNGVSRPRRVAASAALVALLASPVWLPGPALSLETVVDRTLRPDQQQASEFAQVLQRVRAEPRAVYSEPLDIVVLAGRDLQLEPFIFSILYGEGKWDATPAVRQICSGEIGLLVLDHRLEGPYWLTDNYPHWAAPVLEALRATMRLERQQARLFLYVPDPQPGNPPPPVCH